MNLPAIFQNKKFISAIVLILVIIFFISYSWYILIPRTTEMHGKIHAGPDPKSIVWSMWWNHHQILKDPINLYRANIFYPEQNSLAHSDSLIVPSLIVLPFKAFISSPTVLFNIAFWAAFALAGIFMYFLVKHLTGSHFLGLLAGVFYSFSPYRLDNVTHLQYTSHQWLPLILLSFILFFLERKKLWGFAAAIFTWATALSCGAYLLMAVIPLGLLIVFLWIAKPIDKNQMLYLALSGVLLILILAPHAYQIVTARASAGAVIRNDELIRFSNDVLDFAKQPKYMTSAPYSILPEQIKSRYFTAFPGFLLSGLIIAAFWLYFSSGSKENTEHPLILWMKVNKYLLMAVLAIFLSLVIWTTFNPPPEEVKDFNIFTLLTWALFLLLITFAALSAWAYKHDLLDHQTFFIRIFISLASICALFTFGIYLHVNNHMVGMNLYWFFFNKFPGYNSFRQLFHYNTFTMLFAVPAAALALKNIMSLPRKILIGVMIAIGILVAFEYQTDMSIDYADIPTELPPAYAWLKQQPDPAPVLELPMWGYPYHAEGDREYWSMYHHKPLVNGLFSYPPKEYNFLTAAVKNFPSRASIQYVQKYIHVKYIIVRLSHFHQNDREQMLQLFEQKWSNYKLVDKFPYFYVFENSKWDDSMFYNTSWRDVKKR